MADSYQTSVTIAANTDQVTKTTTYSVDGTTLTGDSTTLGHQALPVVDGYTAANVPQGAASDSVVKYGDSDITLDVVYLPDPVGALITFTDDTTGEVLTWGDWSAAQTFDAVASPTITGYTPSEATVAAATVMATDANSTVTVYYTADGAEATLNVIDDTAETTLETLTNTGKVDDVITFSSDHGTSVAAIIKYYTDLGYVVASDDFTSGTTYTAAAQTFNIHLTHKLQAVEDTKTVAETIHYVYSDGTKAADDYTTTTTAFTRTGIEDLVTKEVDWKAWSPTSQTFAAVTSPTITGYTADQATVAAVDVTGDSADVETTVTYTANQQTVEIFLIDDDAPAGQRKLGSLTATGAYNTLIDFATSGTTVADWLAEYTGGTDAKYELVRNSYKGDENYQADNSKNLFEIHLSHKKETTITSQTVTETIHYVYANGPKTAQKAAADATATLTFTRDGVIDLVTGSTTWDAWKQNSQSFAAVDSPTITGYVADQATVAAVTVTPTSEDVEQTVYYSLAAESGTLTFIDDSTGATLKTMTAKGDYGTLITFTQDGKTAAKWLAAYEDAGYDLVSSDYQAGATFAADTADNQYAIHLSHHHDVTTATITKTVHYWYGQVGGTAVADPYTTSATIVADTDRVTGVTTYTVNGQADEDGTATLGYQALPSAKAGYTATEIDAGATSDSTVTQTSSNLDLNVVYTADPASATVTLVDDGDDGATLETVDASGHVDEEIGFSSSHGSSLAEIISYYQDLGYTVTSNDFTAGDTYQADAAANQFTVHLAHGTEAASDSKTVTETIHYTYTDGTTAAPDAVATKTFTRTGTKDLVTGTTTWNAWSAAQSFDAVTSPTITGYVASADQVAAIEVTAASADVEKTVVYTELNDATISFVDDSDGGKALQTLTNNGEVGTPISFSSANGESVADLIAYYESLGYVLVANDFTDGTTYQSGTGANQFTVHLAHGTETESVAATVTQTIHYLYADGTQAAADAVATKTFTRTGTKDLVTGTTTWDAWSPAQTFAAVTSPTITGYMASEAKVAAAEVTATSADLDTTVTYTANSETATINFVDDTAKTTLEGLETTGQYGDPIGFSSASGASVAEIIKHYEAMGYVVQTNTFEDGTTFNEGTNAFEVHFTHGTEVVDDTKTVTQTIHYVYADGTQAAPDVVASKSVTRTGTKDLVTGTTTWNVWSPAQTFAAVMSPTITGYTPSEATVAAQTVTATSADLDTTVTYTANTETATINFVDDTAKTTLEGLETTGQYGDPIGFSSTNGASVAEIIQHYESLGYVVQTNNYTDGTTFDEGANAFEVHFTHGTEAVNDAKTVTETVHYLYADGTTAAPDVVTTKSFTRTGTKDLVTGTMTWDAWSPAQIFAAVTSSTITGYKASDAEVAAAEVTATSDDIDRTVVYTAIPVETSDATISFVDDDNGGATLETLTSSGEVGTPITFSSTSGKSIAELIDYYESLGYVLVSNDYTDGTTYQSGDGSQFTVHFTHGTETVNDAKTVTQTIHYLYADGTTAAPDVVASKSFTRTGTKDLVTGMTTWNAWSPAQTFAAVTSPTITGYTASDAEVAAVEVTATSGDIDRTVVYTTIPVETSDATISFVDDDNNGTTLETLTSSGEVGTPITFSSTSSKSVAEIIQYYESLGYVLVSNDYTDGTTYQAGDDSNQFTVHFAHGTVEKSDSKEVSKMIQYLYEDGTQAAPDVVITKVFTRTGTTDLVTGVTTWGEWSPAQVYATVVSPNIPGFVPDQHQIDEALVTAESGDVVEKVIYKLGSSNPYHPGEPGKPDHPVTPGDQTTPGGGSTTTTPGQPGVAGQTGTNGQAGTASPNKASDQAAANGQSAASKSATLPQTGAGENQGLTALGLLAGMLATALGFGKKKKKKD